MYSNVQRLGASKVFFVFEILFQFKIFVFYFNIFENVIYSCDEKAELSSGMTLSLNLSDMLIGAQETFLIIINVEKSCTA